MNDMWKVLRRRWKYLTAKLSGRWEETADPAVQLEQAIGEAQDQHRKLVEQAANVVANQKRTELQLNRAMQDLENVNASTRRALTMANEAAQRGDAAKAADYNQTAEAFANRLIATEKQVDDLKTMHYQATQAAQQAKAAVQQNQAAMQQRLAERQKLLSQLDQARMQEQLNAAMTTLSQTVGQDVPTLDEVRSKIEAQYAKALGTAELAGQGVEARMLEIEQASVYSEAHQRLDEMRSEMGLPSGGQPAAVGPGAPAQQALGAGGPEGQTTGAATAPNQAPTEVANQAPAPDGAPEPPEAPAPGQPPAKAQPAPPAS